MPTALTPAELEKKARRIRIASRRTAARQLAGEFQSTFRGTGIEFESVREYAYGDDVRSIDWNVTARAGKPHVKRFVESRERSVLLAVDASASLDFGSGARAKRDVAVEAAAVLALAALANGDRVGMLQFAAGLEAFLPPGRGSEWQGRLIHELLARRPRGVGTDLDAALERIERRLRQRSVVFLVSDFQDPLPERTLARLARRHDLVAVAVFDPRERALAGGALLDAVDPETGRSFALDSGSARERAAFARAAAAHVQRRDAAFARAGIDVLELSTAADLLGPLLAFFERRERRSRSAGRGR